MTPEEITQQLGQFTGTEGYYRIAQNAVLTDGTQFIAESTGAYWLFQDSALYMQGYEKKDEFAVIRLAIDEERSFIVTLGDGNDHWQPLFGGEFTDFPLGDSFEFWAGWQDSFWVFMLPSEY